MSNNGENEQCLNKKVNNFLFYFCHNKKQIDFLNVHCVKCKKSIFYVKIKSIFDMIWVLLSTALK